MNLDLLSNWTRYRQSLCEGCFAYCCRLPVEVDLSDLIRMGLASEDDRAGSPKKLARRLEKEGYVKAFRARSGLFTLQQTQRGDCLFLDEQRRCTIYDKRPQVCRKFPQIGPRPGYCPCKKI